MKLPGTIKPLRQRNQAAVGVVALVLIMLISALAFFSKDLPIIGSGTTYSALFTESAGLDAGNEVRVAGIKVGEVKDVSLDGNRVVAKFTVDGVSLGNQTRASIQIKTMLGEKYLELDPAGTGDLDPDKPIPVQRTTSPYDIPDALNELTATTGQLDTKQLAQSFHTIADTIRGAPQQTGQALDGLSKLSASLADRDAQLSNLLHNTADVSKIVADRNAQVSRLVSDGNLLMQELQQRRDAISGLLTGTQQLSAQLHGLVIDNQQQLRPALDKLNAVTTMLQRNQDNLNRTLAAMAPYVRAFNNTVGNGRWFDGYLCGLMPPTMNSGPVQSNPRGCDVPVPNSSSQGSPPPNSSPRSGP